MTLPTFQQVTLGLLALSAIALVYLHGENGRQSDSLTQLGQAVGEKQTLITKQAEAIADIQQLRAAVASIAAESTRTRQAISAQAAAMDQSLQELKRNDKAISDYLSSRVPAAIGVRWARAETADPAVYRQAGGNVRLNVVPTPSPAAAGTK